MEFLTTASKDVQSDVLLFKNGTRKRYYKYKLLNRYNVYKKDLLTVEQGLVSMKSLAQIKRVGIFNMIGLDADIDWLNDRIAPFVVLQAGSTVLEYPLGIMLLSSPEKNSDDSVDKYTVTCYDETDVLKQDRITTRLAFDVNSYYTDNIKSVIASANIVSYSIPDSAGTLNRVIEYPVGTNKLEIVNDLLNQINYTSLYTTNAGLVTAKPYVLPENRPVEFEYLENNQSIIFNSDFSESTPVSSIPNSWVGLTSNPETASMISTYQNNNPNDPTSVPSRGRIISAEPITFDDVADLQTLNDLVVRAAKEQSSIYGKVTFKTPLMPVHGYLDKYSLQHKTETYDFVETDWEMALREHNPYMSHTVRRVVSYG